MAGISQQILKVVDRSFRSFFYLLKKAKRGEYRFHDVRVPYYLDKEGYFALILSTTAITIRDGYLLLPISNQFKKEHPDLDRIEIPFPARLTGKVIKEVRILPKERARFFTIQFVYENEPEPQPVSPDKTLAIDLGLDNLAACIDGTNGASFIIDGKQIKSINHWYNKRMARLQSVLDLQKLPRSEQIARITLKRSNRIHDCMMKSARTIINYCLEHQIGTMVV